MERFGRKISILLITLPAIICQLILIFLPDLNWYYTARAIGGFSQAGTYVVLPVYTAEISPSKIRGFLSISGITALLSGMLFSYSIGPYVSLTTFNIILLVPPAILIVGTILLIVPETPHYYVYKKQETKAKEVLIYIRGTTDVDKESEDIKRNANVAQPSSIEMFPEMFKDTAAKRALFLSFLLSLSMNFSGIGFILTYTESIFKTTGSDIDPSVSAIIIGTVQLCVCLISSNFVDKWGRRIMILISTCGVILSQIVFGVYYFLKDHHYNVHSVSWLPLVSLISLIVFLCIGLGPLPQVVISELFPITFKVVGITFVTSIGNIYTFFLTLYYRNLVDGIGSGPTMWLYAGVLIILQIFMYFFLFETKGKTLQQIQDILNAK